MGKTWTNISAQINKILARTQLWSAHGITHGNNFLFCRLARRKDLLGKYKGRLLTKEDVLTTPEGAFAFSVWLAETGYF